MSKRTEGVLSGLQERVRRTLTRRCLVAAV